MIKVLKRKSSVFRFYFLDLSPAHTQLFQNPNRDFFQGGLLEYATFMRHVQHLCTHTEIVFQHFLSDICLKIILSDYKQW